MEEELLVPILKVRLRGCFNYGKMRVGLKLRERLMRLMTLL